MKNKGFVHILVLILVVLGIGLLAYFSLKPNSNPPPDHPAIIFSRGSKVEIFNKYQSTTQNLKNWQKYFNSKCGYSILFPPQYEIDVKTPPINSIDIVCSEIYISKKSIPEKPTLRVRAMRDGYLAENIPITGNLDLQLDNNSVRINKVQLLNQKDHATITKQGNFSPGWQNLTSEPLRNKGEIYDFRVFYNDDNNNTNLKELLDIIYSFKLLGSSNDGITYKNERFGFTFDLNDLTVEEEKSSSGYGVLYINLMDKGEQTIRIEVNYDKPSMFLSERLKPTKKVTKNNIIWTVYPKSEYCDGGGCGYEPISYETVYNDVQYIIGLTNVTDEEFEIFLSTFKFSK